MSPHSRGCFWTRRLTSGTSTVLRCLGVPARVITNYNSAHDVDGNLSVDYLLDANLDSTDTRRQDSKW